MKFCRRQLGLQEDQVGRSLARVGNAHGGTIQAAPARHRQPRFTEAQHQHMRFLQLAKHFDSRLSRFCVDGYAPVQRNLSDDSPISTSSMVMIQKRTVTCVSFQPDNSKW